MFKRGPIIVVGIIVVLLLISPFAIGMFVENGVREQIAIYDSQPSWDATVESYERGFRSSTARLNIALSSAELAELESDPALAALANFSLPVIVEISHGPVLLDGGFPLGTTAVRAYIDPESQLSTMAQQFLGMPYIIELRGRSGFGMGFDFEGEIPAFDGAFADTSYAFSGLDFTGNARGGDVTLDALLEEASLQGMGESMLLEALAVTGNWEGRARQIALGDFEMTLGRLVASNALTGGAPVFSANDLGITSSVVESDGGELLELRALYSMGSLMLGDALDLSDAALGLNLLEIDAEGANELYRISGEIASVEDPLLLLDTMMPALDKIVAAGPTLSIDPLQFSMREGDLDASLDVSIDPSVLPTGSARDLQNIAFAMGAVSANLDLRASKDLVERITAMIMTTQIAMMPGPGGGQMSPEQIQAMAEAQAGLTLVALTAQGILVDDGENFTATIRFADGQATANGAPLSLFSFM